MILVTGASGLVGSRVIEALLQQKQPVRAFARGQTDWRENPMPQFRRMGVDVMSGDLKNAERVTAAVSGCTAVIHCAAALLASADEIQATNSAATKRLVAIAESQGVQRFVHVSCLGASEFNNSPYMRSKWEGEQAVRQCRLAWTIVRPSLMFGRGSLLVNALDFWVSRLPIVPVIGSGLNRINPVSAHDVAGLIMSVLYNRDTVGQTYDVTGPRSYSLTEMLELAAPEYTGKTKQHIKFPAKAGYFLAAWLHKLNPRTPISGDVMRLLTTEMEGDPALIQQQFGLKLTPFESSFKRLR